jgi:hypothetical protein
VISEFALNRKEKDLLSPCLKVSSTAWRNLSLLADRRTKGVPSGCAAPEAPVCDAGKTPVNVFFDNLEIGAGNWTHSAATGADAWYPLVTGYAASGLYSLYGYDIDDISDSSTQMTNAVHIPSGAFLHFKHAYSFDSFEYYSSYYSKRPK